MLDFLVDNILFVLVECLSRDQDSQTCHDFFKPFHDFPDLSTRISLGSFSSLLSQNGNKLYPSLSRYLSVLVLSGKLSRFSLF